MILRLAAAYGAGQALAASAIIVIAGILLGQQSVGVTRQPLPLAWPVGVLLVMAAQIPLQDILGTTERSAARAVQARAVRAGLSILVITAGLVVDAATHGDPRLTVFLLLLTAAGFAVVPLTPADAWVATAGLGMAWLGLQFLTPLGLSMVPLLDGVGVVAAACTALSAGALYVVADPPLLRRLR